MKKEITQREALKRLKKVQLEIRDVSSRCMTVNHIFTEAAIKNIQSAKEVLLKQIDPSSPYFSNL